MVSSGNHPQGEVTSDHLEARQNSNAGDDAFNNADKYSDSDQEKKSSIMLPEKAVQKPDAVVHASQSGQEGGSSSKVSQTPYIGVPTLKSDEEGSIPSVIREKVSEDGYNWRKYGQKLVKGNEFVRSYYKCTHPNCPVKKQVERSHKGQITDTVYFGQHDHPMPQLVPVAVGFALSIADERTDGLSSVSIVEKSLNAHDNGSQRIESVDAHLPSKFVASKKIKGAPSQPNQLPDDIKSDDAPESKRRNTEHSDVDAVPVDKPAVESRLVVRTHSSSDIVNDGYRWRKYGQKLVKGNPNPRSYYRCSTPGCPVKKHVERACDDRKLLITTYEGQHDHDMPPTRTIIHNKTAAGIHKTTDVGDAGTKADERNADCGMVIRANSARGSDQGK